MREIDPVKTARRVAVFCGSSTGSRTQYRTAAEQLAGALCARGIGLVYGGGNVGLMGVLADAMLARGGDVVGVVPEALAAKEVAHLGLPDLRIVDSMHARKAMMADLADAFIALPGGFGTFEEIIEVVTWTQLGLHVKRTGLINVLGFYDPLLAQFDHAVAEGFLKATSRSLVAAHADPEALLALVLEPPSPVEPKWIRSPAQT
jgi:uncharacterized protein (TIGR00730 family)